MQDGIGTPRSPKLQGPTGMWRNLPGQIKLLQGNKIIGIMVNDVPVERGRCLTVRLFARYIGIDYSGAETSTSSLPGLRVYVAGIDDAPKEIDPPPSPRKYWTRRGLAEWLVASTRSAGNTIPGFVLNVHKLSLQTFKYSMVPEPWALALDLLKADIIRIHKV